MAIKKFESPRFVAYSKSHADYYQNKEDGWLGKDSLTIFRGGFQKDLFLFAYAIGKNRKEKSTFGTNDRILNIPTTAMDEKEQWAILASGIEESKDILCLADQKEIYEKAEEYAKEGIEIIKSRMDKYGINYPKHLEAELKEILGVI